ncbi:nucleoside hydrolase [Dysgonomonas sp.]
MKKLIYIISFIFLGTICFAGNKQTLDNEIKGGGVKMILDLDTGIDDAMALAYALADPSIELIGVTTVFGNVATEESTTNTLNILDLLNCKDVPVYEGADRAIGEKEKYIKSSRSVHGNNGVGGVLIPKSSRTAKTKSGSDFIIESARKYGKDLVVVAVGPPTNLTEAIRKEPNLKNMVGKIVIMGGALIVKGNVSPYAEANIFHDPVGSNELFLNGTPLTMVGLDVTLRTLLTKKETKKWRELNTASGKIFADMVDFYINAYNKKSPKLQGCGLHDPLAVAVAVHPELVKVLNLHMQVETGGEAIGRTVAITEKLNDPNPNVSVCVDVKVGEFMKLFMNNLTGLFKAN